MFPGYTPKRPQPDPSQVDPTAKTSTSRGFFQGSTREINVLENRFLQQAVNIANDPTDVEQRL